MSEKGGGSSKVRAFMGQTPRNLKQKFFSVLGSSSEYKKQLISGISHKIDVALSFASTSTETPENINEAKLWKKLREQHEKSKAANSSEIYSLDDHIVDYELRRVKERRAHEEILSGRYRQPAFIAHSNIRVDQRKKNDPVSSPSIVLVESSSSADAAAPHNNHHPSIDNNLATNATIISHHSVTINNSKSSSPSHNNNNNTNKNALTTKENNLLAIPVANSCSSATSECGDDNLSLCEGSIDSLEVKMWHKSETESVAPSCSSLSMDSSTDEAVFDFMRRFVTTLFTDSLAITLEFKHQFGQYSRVAAGRMWFARFVSSQRTKTKRVNETTFYALIQYFAIVLFECKECEDFMPAKHLMSLCFTFYQEVEVPGCDPYREYLFNYLRDQPIWHSLRFWNAALFYALQKDKVPKTTAAAFDNNARKYSSSSMQLKTLNEEDTPKDALGKDSKVQLLPRREPSRSISESSLSTTSSSTSTSETGRTTDSSLRLKNVMARKVNRSRSSTIAGVASAAAAALGEDNTFDLDERKLQDNTNVAFSQLGSLTCNMHAFGLSRDLCCEFLKKQCHILNLTKEQEKLLYDNVTRLYRETDPWREQVHQKAATK